MTKSKQYFKPVDTKVNFPEMEREIQDKWYKEGVLGKYLQKNNNSKETFSFVDGPITANNPMGVHHGWGRTYKDMWQRYNNMLGKRQRFQNGFDCQGLWVEVEVEKELGFKSKKDIESLVPGDPKASIAKFVELCKERVYKYASIQTEQSKRLGYFMDWENSYYTMSDENNYMIWHFLKKCHENGWIYKGKESVPWCPRCETAISQHEMLTEDYKEVVHKSIIMEFPIEGKDREFLLVWTTTPWTIPANIAVAVDKDIEYSLVEGATGDRFWIAKGALDRIFGKEYKSIIKTVKGEKLLGLKYKTAFEDLPAVKKAAEEVPALFHTVILTDPRIMPINDSEGTGLVHTAVSAGSEDFKLGKKLGLPMIPVIADNADYLEGMGFLTGQNAKKHPEIILDYLVQREKEKDEDWVFRIENYKHRYPACWRCKKELVWKVADEWYIAMDKKGVSSQKTLRQRMINVAKNIKWIPEFGLERELDWLTNMHDWLISKPNRYWGLALPIYECKKCNKFDVIGGKEELKEKSVVGWSKFEGHTPHKPWIDEVKISCDSCGETVERLPHVGNVWLDAGIVPFSTIAEDNKGKPLYLTQNEKWKDWYPADFITESFPGQFKNWFYSLIAMSTVLENKPPMKTVLGFATMLAEDGRAMHKSWGNSIEFNEGAEKIGVDVMRWIFVRQNPTDNLLFGYNSANEIRRQFHLKLWNVYNFFVTYANIDHWKPDLSTEFPNSGTLPVLDRWILSRLSQTAETVTISLNQYKANHAALEIEDFVDDLSNWYVRRSRDRVGSVNNLNEKSNEFYETLHFTLEILSRLIAPLNPHIAEEIYTNITKNESVHLSNWPSADVMFTKDNLLIDEMNEIRLIVEKGHALRKDSAIPVRQPLEKITIYNSKFTSQELVELIKDELNIKQVVVERSTGELKVELDTKLTPKLKAEGEARDLVRQIQARRKEIGTKLEDTVIVTLPFWPEDFEDYIKDKALVKEIKKGDFSVEL
jgi:isoleucyl-tRNA synthetase